jgi:dTDP-4-dehydrorhamnose reductase
MSLQVIGQSGMLGRAVMRAAVVRGIPVSPPQCTLEMVTPSHIHAAVVINCAGLVKQRLREYGPVRCMAVNAVGPHRLAGACHDRRARLIHVSTDCVFGHTGPHAENANIYAHADIYARSKFAGEVGAPHLTIRTSFVGWGPRGLLHDLAGADPVYASDRLYWSGHTVDYVAGLLLDLVDRDDLTGLLHVPGEFQTRWSLCQALKARFDLPARIVRDDTFIADRRLVSLRWSQEGLDAPPPFAAQLETMGGPS